MLLWRAASNDSYSVPDVKAMAAKEEHKAVKHLHKQPKYQQAELNKGWTYVASGVSKDEGQRKQSSPHGHSHLSRSALAWLEQSCNAGKLYV
jgi:hypothetical protein